MPIDNVGPVKLLVWKSGEIGFFSTEPDRSMLHLETRYEMMHCTHSRCPFLGATMKPDMAMSSGDVNPAKGY